MEEVIEVDEKDIPKYQYDSVLPTRVEVYQKEVVKEVKKSVPNYIE